MINFCHVKPDQKIVVCSWLVECDPRLAVWTVLQGDVEKGFFCLLACVCTSFSAINQGTAKRSPVTPWGDLDRPHVVATRLKNICVLVYGNVRVF